MRILWLRRFGPWVCLRFPPAQQTYAGDSGYNVTPFTVPGALTIGVGDVSDAGEVVGTYTATGAGGQVQYFGFSRSASGVFETLTPPGATADVYVLSISSQGWIFGYYALGPTTYQGFVYKDGAYRLVSVEGKSTMVLAGNDNGALLVGLPENPVSYIYRPGQPLVPLQAPGQQETYGSAINDNGVVVGEYTDYYSESYLTYGFAFAGNTYAPVNIPPGNKDTFPYWINNEGMIVGDYLYQNQYYHGFIYKSGTFRDFSMTGAVHTFVSGCNDAGVLSGTYQDANGNQIGFIATPIS